MADLEEARTVLVGRNHSHGPEGRHSEGLFELSKAWAWCYRPPEPHGGAEVLVQSK
jgi:hypothetical protein